MTRRVRITISAYASCNDERYMSALLAAAIVTKAKSDHVSQGCEPYESVEIVHVPLSTIGWLDQYYAPQAVQVHYYVEYVAVPWHARRIRRLEAELADAREDIALWIDSAVEGSS